MPIILRDSIYHNKKNHKQYVVLGVFVCYAATVQVDAKEAEASDKRARRAEVVSRLAAATHVYVPCNTSEMALQSFFLVRTW